MGPAASPVIRQQGQRHCAGALPVEVEGPLEAGTLGPGLSTMEEGSGAGLWGCPASLEALTRHTTQRLT